MVFADYNIRNYQKKKKEQLIAINEEIIQEIKDTTDQQSTLEQQIRKNIYDLPWVNQRAIVERDVEGKAKNEHNHPP